MSIGWYTFMKRLIFFHESENTFPGFSLLWFGFSQRPCYGYLQNYSETFTLISYRRQQYYPFKNYGRKLFQVLKKYKRQCCILWSGGVWSMPLNAIFACKHLPHIFLNTQACSSILTWASREGTQALFIDLWKALSFIKKQNQRVWGLQDQPFNLSAAYHQLQDTPLQERSPADSSILRSFF